VRRVSVCILLLVGLAAYSNESGELTFDDLFRQSAIRHVALSPNGKLIAYFRNNTFVVGNPNAGYSDIRDFYKGLRIVDLDWIGPRTLWVQSWGTATGTRYSTAIGITDSVENGYSMLGFQDHTVPGFISDPLPEDGDHVIFAKLRVNDETIATDLYKINVFGPMERELRRSNKIDTGSDDFFYYARDAAGDFTLGIRITEEVPEIWRKLPDGDSWEHIWTADTESRFIPWQISEDSKTLWVLTNALTDKIAAVAFDLENRKFGEILYEHDRVDLDGIIHSRTDRTPVGVIYTEQGLVRYHFFSEDKNAEFDKLQAHFPDKGILLIGYSEDSTVRLVFASSPSERGSIHVCDVVRDQCDSLESIAPWMEGKLISETIALDIPSTDGFVVEAFLTLPVSGGDSIPLVALPHGGPIGISDDRYFSGEVQWLARNGYAVLQVNYRGSSGYGQEFETAGLRQWGRGIEDDIEASVRKVLDDYAQIDGSRIGIFGGSYGGYSALMSVIRHPELFRCAASWAGVTDLTLLFTQTSMSRSDYLRDILVRYVGDPDIDYDEQTENSPVYRYKDIMRPILLGHGMEDTVVDVEHSWRLRKMMILTGMDPEFVLLDDVGHGFSYVNEAQQFYEPLLEFLDKHLKAD